MRVLAVSCSALLISGCFLFNPYGKRLQSLQSQASAVGQRVEQLEFQAGYGPLVTGGSTVSEAPRILDEPLSNPAVLNPTALNPTALPRLLGASSPEPSKLPGMPIDGRKAMEKLGRGLINLITGWVEIPKRMDETNKRSSLGPALTIGLLRGLGHGFVRTTAGAYEIVTFPFPAPPGYQPIIHPEYVFTQEYEDVVRDDGEAQEEGSGADPNNGGAG